MYVHACPTAAAAAADGGVGRIHTLTHVSSLKAQFGSFNAWVPPTWRL